MIGGYHPWFHDQLKQRIALEKVNRAVSLGNGDAGDFSDYRFGVGLIAGLELALDLADELKREIDSQ